MLDELLVARRAALLHSKAALRLFQGVVCHAYAPDGSMYGVCRTYSTIAFDDVKATAAPQCRRETHDGYFRQRRSPRRPQADSLETNPAHRNHILARASIE